MAKSKKKYYKVLKDLTYKGRFYEAGKKIYLNSKESEVLINKYLVTK